VTVTVRWIPLVPAAYGTRVARPASMTMLIPDGDGAPLGRKLRPVAGGHCIVGKRLKGSRQAGHESFNLSRSFSLRSCKSIVVWLSRSFAVSVSRPVLPYLACSRMMS
jgi:hypothetical protein